MPQMMKALVKREPARGIWMDEAPLLPGTAGFMLGGVTAGATCGLLKP